MSGLSPAEAAARLAVVGPNRTTPPVRRGWVRRLLAQLTDPLVLVLLVAGVLTTSTGDLPDTLIIALVVVTNTAMGVVQEHRAESALDELARMVSPTVVVLRDDLPTTVDSADVVPGDVVVLAAGDLVPADGTVTVAERLACDESAMTGESVAVERPVGDEVVAGTVVVRGRGRVVVSRTGDRSGQGRLAQLVREAPRRRTPLQGRMARLSAVLVVVVLGLTLVVVVVGLLGGRPLAEMLVVGASLAVAAVPESLPAVVAVSLALGARRMARHSAVVRRLAAVETLGAVTVIATDKTGTLTEGRMAVAQVWLPGSAVAVPVEGLDRAPAGAVADLLRAGVLCNDAHRVTGDDGSTTSVGDGIEAALLDLGVGRGVDVEEVRRVWRREAEEPFDPVVRRMRTRHRRADGDRLDVVKGAAEAVLPDVDVPGAARAAEDLAAAGYRVLGLLDRRGEGPWRLLGLVAITDPPRPSAAAAVAACHRAGVRLVVVTGDHPGTAYDVARRVGIASDPAATVNAEELAAGELGPRASDAAVFARVRPEQKVELVRALQADGEIVAMLGDGVNDAPALRHADMGVAAGRSGTEVARQAADLVLLDDDLGTVVVAIREGRRIFANLRSFLVYAVSGGLAEVLVMIVGPAVGLALPLLPAQILWINLLTHGMTGVAFSGEAADPREMARPPVSPAEAVLARAQVPTLLAAAVALAVTSLAVGVGAGAAESRSAVFLTLGLGQLGVALALRVRPPEVAGLRHQGLLLAVLVAGCAQVLGVLVPWLRDLLGTQVPSGATLVVAVACAAVPGLVVRVTRRGPPPPTVGHTGGQTIGRAHQVGGHGGVRPPPWPVDGEMRPGPGSTILGRWIRWRR